MWADPHPDTVVEKLMSFTQKEFEHGLERLAHGPVVIGDGGVYELAAAAHGHRVTCRFVPQPDAVLGGLLRLPRAQVTLHLADLDEEHRIEFMHRFEHTFQRGGG